MTASLRTRLPLLVAALMVVVLAVRPPDLRPVAPEVDGVHPVRALEALATAFVPGRGFLDKYPPLPSVLFGLAAAAAQPGLAAATVGLVDLPERERAQRLWALRNPLAGALSAERLVSLLAMALAAALVARLGAELSRRAGASPSAAMLGATVAGVAFASSVTARYYAGTANVDALALLASLLCIERLVAGRFVAAALAAALATACKDPAFVLGPVVLVAAWREGLPEPARRRQVVACALAGLVAFALFSGALTSPATFAAHARYLVAGGVAGVDAVDKSSLTGWGRFAGHVLALFPGAAGWATTALGVIGLAACPARERSVLLLAIAVTLAGFVAAVGFAYPRFVLLPQALLAAAAGVAVACGPWRALPGTRPRRLVRIAVLGLLAFDLGGLVARTDVVLDPARDPRALFAAAVAERLPEGGRLVLFAEHREHGPPLDPTRWDVTVLGLAEAESQLAAWRAAPGQRPDLLGVLSFPTDLPSGAPSPPHLPPKPGERLGGQFEVREVFGAPTGAWVERQMAVRPTLSLLAPVSP